MVVLTKDRLAQAGWRRVITGRFLSGFSQLMLSAQAPGTQVKPHRLTVSNYGGRVNIRQPLTISVTFGMAYIVTELR